MVGVTLLFPGKVALLLILLGLVVERLQNSEIESPDQE